MPELYRQGNWMIRVYAADHNPPHFHVVTPEAEALVRIDTLEVIMGSVPAKVLRAAREWAEANEAKIAAEWKRLNGR